MRVIIINEKCFTFQKLFMWEFKHHKGVFLPLMEVLVLVRLEPELNAHVSKYGIFIAVELTCLDMLIHVTALWRNVLYIRYLNL